MLQRMSFSFSQDTLSQAGAVAPDTLPLADSQYSSGDLGQSQDSGDSGYPASGSPGWARAPVRPRATLPRPPTWPSVLSRESWAGWRTSSAAAAETAGLGAPQASGVK